MFKIGDYVVHGANGVCRVESIGTLDFDASDGQKLYYTLEPVYEKGSRVYTPVESDKVSMRKIMSSQEVWELIDEIPRLKLLESVDDKMIQKIYKDSIREYDCRQLVRIIKTIYIKNEQRRSNGKKPSYTDEKYLRAAEDFLYGELAMILNIKKDEVEGFISRKIEEKEAVC